MTIEDRPSGDSDNDSNDTVLDISIIFPANEENPRRQKSNLSVTRS